jgi:hypothetical protein
MFLDLSGLRPARWHTLPTGKMFLDLTGVRLSLVTGWPTEECSWTYPASGQLQVEFCQRQRNRIPDAVQEMLSRVFTPLAVVR